MSVGGAFTMGALALAAEGANAVGAVRMTLLPEELGIELVRAAGFRAGFVPGGVAEAVSLRVPYTAVRGLVRRGRALCLWLDPAVAAPHTRFTLARFTIDPADALGRAYEARRRAALLAALGPAALGLVAAASVSSSLVSGPLGRLSLGLLVALVTWLSLREMLRWATWGGPDSDRLRDAFEVELCRRLGFSPVTTAPFAPPPAPSLPGLAPAQDSPSRARGPILIGLFAAFAVAAVAFLQRYAGPPDPAALPPPPVPLLSARLAPRMPEVRALFSLPAGPLLPRCVCARADSPLWKDGLPALSVLLAPRAEDGSGHVVPSTLRGGLPSYDFDLSVVNDSATPMPDVRVLVTFARRNDEGKRVGATERGLYWGKPLQPGRAVKWHVTAPGSEMRIEPGITALLDPSNAPAPADAFFELTKARQRVVRIHAAMMLAYLRDPRAAEALASLGAPTPAEELVLERIARAARPVFTCDARVEAGSLTACVFNGSVEPARASGFRARSAVQGEPARVVPLEPVEVPVHDGVRVTVPSDGTPLPAELEPLLSSP